MGIRVGVLLALSLRGCSNSAAPSTPPRVPVPINTATGGRIWRSTGVAPSSGSRATARPTTLSWPTGMETGRGGSAIDLGPGINDHAGGVLQDNPHISADGTALWFTSSRPTGSRGGKDIWFSSRSGGIWSGPVNLGAPFNTAGDDDQFWFAPGTLDIYGPSGLMHCVSNGATCSGAPNVVTIPGCGFAAEVSITDDGQLMFFGCGDLATGRVRIMLSRKQPSGWGTATPVD